MTSNKNPKGSLKNYNLWIESELNDCILKSKSQSSFQNLIHSLLQTSPNPSQVICHSANKFRSSKALTVPESFDFLKTLKKISANLLLKLLSYLKLKDFVALIETCQSLKTLLDNNKFWKGIARDLTIPNKAFGLVSIKQFYRFLLVTDKVGVLYHTGFLFSLQTPQITVDLAKTLVDFTNIKCQKIKELLSTIRLEHAILSDVKLSWSKEKNEIYLWISGLNMADYSWSCAHKTVKKPTAFILRKYTFSRETLIKNASFLNEKFIMIEIEITDSLKESDTANKKQKIEQTKCLASNSNGISTFLLYNLENEVRYCIFGENSNNIFKFTFPIDNESPEKGSTLPLRNTKTNIGTKIFQDNEKILFFTQKTKSPIVIIKDLKTGEELIRSTINLNSPLDDIILPKIPSTYKDMTFYLLDESFAVYCAQLIDSRLNLKMMILDIPQISTMQDPVKGLYPEAFFITKEYYHGIYENKTDKDQGRSQTEFLVVNKYDMFYFIVLDKWKLYKFSFSNYSTQTIIQDWNIYNNKLFILTLDGTYVFQFSLKEFNGELLGHTQSIRNVCYNPSKQKILLSDCFTVQLQLFPYGTKQDLHLKMLIGSTQNLIYTSITKKIWCASSFKVEDLLPENSERGINVKFEQEKLLIKTSKHNFFFDFEAKLSRKFAIMSETKWGRNQVTINLDKSLLSRKNLGSFENNVKEKKNSFKLLRLVENINRDQEKGIEKKKWDDKEEKSEKEKRKEQKILRAQKGDKYYKKYRQRSRSEKIFL